MKKILLIVNIFFMLSFLFSCKSDSSITTVDEIIITDKVTPIFDIEIDGNKISWNSFLYDNPDNLIYVYDGNIYVVDEGNDFETKLTIISKKESSLIKEVNVVYKRKIVEDFEFKVLNERIYPGEWIEYEIVDENLNIVNDYNLEFENEAFIIDIEENRFRLSENINLNEDFSINVSVDNITKDYTLKVDSQVYLVYNAMQLRRMASDLYGYFKLMCDIDLEDIYWSPIQAFYGVLDGNGYSISGLHLKDTTNYKCGMLINENFGTIKNLHFKDGSLSNATTLEKSAFTFNEYSLFVGSVCGINYGLIENVLASNITFNNIHIGSTEMFLDFEIIIGGLVGMNAGVIDRCGSVNNRMEISVASKYQRALTNAGGLCGYNPHIIKDSYSYDNYIDSKTYGEYKMNYASTIFKIEIGGFVADSNGEIINCISGNNHLAFYADEVASNLYFEGIGSFIGEAQDGDLINCYSLFSMYNAIGLNRVCSVDVVNVIDLFNCKVDRNIWKNIDGRAVINHVFKEEKDEK